MAPLSVQRSYCTARTGHQPFPVPFDARVDTLAFELETSL